MQLNLTLSTSRGPWRPILRTLIEGRFPDDLPASARLRFRPGFEYTLPLRGSWPPVVVMNNEFFIVPWTNPFANGGSSYTQNRFQIGVRLPIADSLPSGLTTSYSPLTYPRAGTQTKSLVSRSPSESSAKRSEAC